MNNETKGKAVDVLAVVETYQCSMADGSVECGWTVKVGEDSIADFPDMDGAIRCAAKYNDGQTA